MVRVTGSLAGRVSDKKAEFEMSPEGYISREQTNLTHRRTVRERGHNLPPKLGRKLLSIRQTSRYSASAISVSSPDSGGRRISKKTIGIAIGVVTSLPIVILLIPVGPGRLPVIKAVVIK